MVAPINEILITAPVLVLPKIKGMYTLDVYAAEKQIGCVFLQKQKAGVRHPVGYWSHTLADEKSNWATRNKKLLAAVWTEKVFLLYLEATRFIVRTIHKAICWILATAKGKSRLASWRLTLVNFDCDIINHADIGPKATGATFGL